jgi:ADP-ribose pyrophosphatase YjhB (NUDIX family)
VDLGESAPAAAEREVVEESGVAIKVTRLAGVYTDPDHDETCEAAWIDPVQIDTLPIQPSMRLRIVQALNEPDTQHIC